MLEHQKSIVDNASTIMNCLHEHMIKMRCPNRANLRLERFHANLVAGTLHCKIFQGV